MTPRLRFAPSPSGYLHIGGARTALFNWLWARKTGGAFVLRIEDTDQARSTDASRAAILESMQWLGLDWDEGPFLQSDRLAIYAAWADKLVEAGHAYRCYCTKETLDAQRAAAGDGYKYPGTCRTRTDEPDLPFVIRFKTTTDGSVTYDDLVFGVRTTPNTEMQDVVLVRSDGMPVYNFGAVIDDMTMGITVVARGRDHMENTPLQILLYRALDARVPALAHLPLMLGPDGRRLSKRHGAVSVTEYRDTGYSPDAVLDYLARFGWSPGEREQRLSRADLVDAFDWAQCSRADGMFAPKKFLAVNHDHLKSPRLVPDDAYARQLLPFVELPSVTTTDILRILPMIRERAQTFVQAAQLADPFFRDPPAMDTAAAQKLLPGAPLRAIRDALAAVPDWSATSLEAALAAWLASANLAMKDIGQPLRLALTGRTASPGLFEVAAALGRDVTLARLDRAYSEYS